MSERNWWDEAREWIRAGRVQSKPKIGLALGGGFARGVAHVGVLRVLEREGIPIDMIAGVSAGSMVAAAYASGSTPDEIGSIARGMRFSDIARWTLSFQGLMGTDPMSQFLKRLLKTYTFESMRMPLAVIASDISAGAPAVFKDKGDVVLPIRASCAYPGLFQPVRYMNHCLVDGLISMDVPAAPLRRMGATHVISVCLPTPVEHVDPQNMLSVVTRCFQIMNERTESQWRRHSSLVIEPKVKDVSWNSFESASLVIEAGERAAEAALPQIRKWFRQPDVTDGEETVAA